MQILSQSVPAPLAARPGRNRFLILVTVALVAVIVASATISSILSGPAAGQAVSVKVTPGYSDALPRIVGQHCGNHCAEMLEGYQWAQLNDIRLPLSCRRYTGAFTDGCLAYLEYRAETRRGARAGR
ncbi:hypothetical protein SGO26_18300 [Cupriavidus metallidurans]|uniref:hypothetical protein n=1 Tax=Cupriavidus TaxID=106589 RepID=UPI00056025F5|nr:MULTISPECIES: hypothetical protein [Cupriavidus]GMG92839.1 hypothetical protein Cmtc_40590 [Cupriavidus sp. TKC]HBD37135.1 hypothetical protein [Cupriavidus sp.]HBO79460.1 hypothetical protein [Cupriavidus sp.]